ncbi:unnamed protein product, partial [Mesorhabditis spiculigera]
MSLLQGYAPRVPPHFPSLHWSASMPEEGQTSLQDQLRLAKEMGFPDDVIMKALKANSTVPDVYTAFENTNTMLDCLHQVQRDLKNQKLSLSVYGESRHGDNTSKMLAPRSASVSRAASLNLGSTGSRGSRSDSHDINRLISTLDKEQERTRKEVESHIARLKERIRSLEYDLQEEKTERERAEEKERQMVNRLKDEEDNLKSEQEENRKLHRELSQNKLDVDKLTLEKLQIQKQLSDQRELSEHRKKGHEEELKEKQRELDSLKSSLATNSVAASRIEELQAENRRLKSELSSQTATYESLAKEHSEAQSLLHTVNQRFNSAEQQLIKCCVCLEQKPEIVFFPCLHVCVCDGCFTREPMSKCPTCRARLVGHSKVFLGS